MDDWQNKHEKDTNFCHYQEPNGLPTKTWSAYKPPRDKTNKVSVRPANTQISLGIRPVWSESSLSAWRNLGPLATHWAHSEDSDQTWRMPRLIWVFAGRTANLLVLSRGGSYKGIFFRFSQTFFFCNHFWSKTVSRHKPNSHNMLCKEAG